MGGGLDDPFIGDVVIDPSDPSVVYAASEGVYKSTDRGRTWTRTGRGLPPLVDLDIDPARPWILYGGNGGTWAGVGIGVYRTTDGGASWTRLTVRLGGSGARAVAVDPNDGDRVYAVTESGVYVSTTRGRRWVPSPEDGGLVDPTALLVDPVDPSVLYASDLFTGGPYKSTDHGRTWRRVDRGMSGGFVFDLAMDPTDPSRLLAASGGVYLSTDGAATWERIPFPDDSASTVRFHPTDPDAFYVGTGDNQHEAGRLLMTPDGGKHWRRHLLRLEGPWWTIADIEFDPTDHGTLYVAARVFEEEGALYRSTDEGRTWKTLGSGTIRGAVRDVTFNPVDPSTVYVATYTGVYVSNDRGETWSPMSDGLFATFVNSIVVAPDGSRLCAAVVAGGVFRLDLD